MIFDWLRGVRRNVTYPAMHTPAPRRIPRHGFSWVEALESRIALSAVVADLPDSSLPDTPPPASPPAVSDSGTDVVGRHLFYNNSRYDDPTLLIGNPAANADDDAAIDPGKTALLPGSVATFASYSGYSRGINGIMIDLASPAATLTADDFEFRVGTAADLNDWTAAPLHADFQVRAGDGENGSTRVTFTWTDGAIRNQWLQVTVLANENTRLNTPDVHYWGNQVGETGNSASTSVDGSDVGIVVNNSSGFTVEPVTSPYDINKSGFVDGADVGLVVNSPTGFTSLLLFSPSIPPVLNPIGDQAAEWGTPLTFTASASDADLPAQGLSFSLDAGAPAAATMDPVSGAFSWTPTAADGPESVEVTVRVTDDLGASDFETITIDVNPAVGVAFLAEELDFIHRSLEFDGDGGSGAAWFDYNNDGELDLFLPNGRTQTSALYENQGDGTFVDVAVAAGLTSTAGGAAVVASDIDNDGNVDLLITGDGGIMNDVPTSFMLYRNLGNGTFTDITATSGIVEPASSGSLAVADIDNDGFLDVFITAFGSAATGIQHASRLFHNNGDLTFTDITVSSGVDADMGACVAGFSDYDGDGDVDLFVSNCNDLTPSATPIQLFRNDGNLTFTDVTAAAGLATELGFWMATSFSDYDNDGDIDLFATNSGDAPGPHSGSPHGLFRNEGDGTFVNVAAAAGVANWEFGWGASFTDLDNDGNADLFFTGSLPTDPFNVIGPAIGNPGRLFFGDGAGSFTHASENLGIDQSNDYTTGVAYGDYNNDGFHDIVITTEDWSPEATGKPVLLTNQGNEHHWLGVELVGTVSNRDAVGARVTLKYGDTENLTQVKEIYAGTSFASMDSQSLRFGLGQHQNATTVQVDWPSGLSETFHIWQGIDQIVELTEGQGTPIGTPFVDPIYDVQTTSDIVYRTNAPVGGGTRQLELDLYEPIGLGQPALRPAAILVHGGGFTGGSKSQSSFVDLANDFASRGYVTVSIDYRLLGDNVPAAPNPAPPGVDQALYNTIIAGIEDTFHAIDWMKTNAADLNIDPDKIVLGGHSAGAYLSMYAGVLDPLEIVGLTNLTLDITGLDVAAILDGAGSVEGLEFAVDSGDPPVFIAHSTDDTVVTIDNANEIRDLLIAQGVSFEFPVITGVGHGLDGKLDFVIGNETVRDQIFDFFEQELTPGSLAQRTTGLFQHLPGTSDDYTLFSPNTTTDTYLIDKDGNVINQWQSTVSAGLHGYLLPDGSLIRAGNSGANSVIDATGGGGIIERFDWDGNLVWTFDYNNDDTFEDAVLQHHDIEVLPNGNILMIAWEAMSAADAEQAGRDDTLPGGGAPLFPDHIIEVQPDLVTGSGGTIVWEWHAIDHLVQDHDPTKDNWYGPNGVAEHPELINFNYISDESNGGSPPEDWLHANGIDYNADLDQIVISIREFSEIWVIDHSTTTAEAAGHTGGNSGMGGDILYRWGNPQTYNAGDAGDRTLYFQHDPKWVETGHPGAGNITIFNNGFTGPERSSVVEIQTTVDGSGDYLLPLAGVPHAPQAPVFTYTAPFADYSRIISGTQRLDNGNTLITFGGDGTFVEVTPTGQEVWRYTNPYTAAGMLGPTDPVPGPIFVDLNTNFVFRATNYDPGYFDPGVIPAPPVPNVDESLAALVSTSVFSQPAGSPSLQTTTPAVDSAATPDNSASAVTKGISDQTSSAPTEMLADSTETETVSLTIDTTSNTSPGLIALTGRITGDRTRVGNTLFVDWGDDSGIDIVRLNADNTFAERHYYLAPGQYTVRVTGGNDNRPFTVATQLVDLEPWRTKEAVNSIRQLRRGETDASQEENADWLHRKSRRR